MTVNKGKPSREHAYPNIKAAIASLLQGCHSPFRSVSTTVGDHVFKSCTLQERIELLFLHLLVLLDTSPEVHALMWRAPSVEMA